MAAPRERYGERMPGARPRWGTLVLVALVLAAPGCATRTLREQIYNRDAVTVLLRQRIEQGSVVQRGYQHPATVSHERLVHILGALEIEESQGEQLKERRAAIHPELLQPIARGLLAGLAAANSDQEIALMAVRTERRLGLFHQRFLTSLVARVRDERLQIDLSRVEWEIPKKSDEEGRPDPLPEPTVGQKQMEFRAVPGPKMLQAGSQGVAVSWRDPLFSLPVRRDDPGQESAGAAPRTRTILMESPIPAEETGDDPTRDADPTRDGLDGDTLRALADLEDARRGGRLTETEYQQRRELLLGSDS